LNVQHFTDEAYKVTKLQIVTLAMDLSDKTRKQRQEIEAKWMSVLLTLDNVRTLSATHRGKQNLFDTICKMKNLERIN